jgi:hypothetical protein
MDVILGIHYCHYLFRWEGKMFARKAFAIPAAFITLLVGAVPVQAGLLDLTGLSSLGFGGLDAGTIGMTRLTPQVERAQAVLGVNLDLQLAPIQ